MRVICPASGESQETFSRFLLLVSGKKGNESSENDLSCFSA
jgi:hypothetical protein